MHAGHLRRSRAGRRRARPELDRLRRPGALGRTGEKSLAVNGVACNAATIRNKTYPLFRYDWGVIPTAPRRTSRSSSSSTGCGRARRPERSSTGRARSPPSTSRRSTRSADRLWTRNSSSRASTDSVRTSAPSLGSARWSAASSSCCWRCSRSSSRRRGRRSPTTGWAGSGPAATSTSRSRRSSPPATSIRRRSF